MTAPKTDFHASDCALHGPPAYPAAPCDCGVAPEMTVGERIVRDWLGAWVNARVIHTTDHLRILAASIDAALIEALDGRARGS